MAYTSSIAFPNMFDISRGIVQILEDDRSVVNRDRLLILTEPTELYNNPDFGVGLRQHIWKYNRPNERAIIQDKISDQLRKHEPCVEADKTTMVTKKVEEITGLDSTRFCRAVLLAQGSFDAFLNALRSSLAKSA